MPDQDGTIRIGTSVDTSGLKAGARESSAITRQLLDDLKAQYAEAEAAVQQATEAMAEAHARLGEAAYAGDQAAIDALTSYDGLLGQAKQSQAELAQRIEATTLALEAQATVESQTAAAAEAAAAQANALAEAQRSLAAASANGITAAVPQAAEAAVPNVGAAVETEAAAAATEAAGQLAEAETAAAAAAAADSDSQAQDAAATAAEAESATKAAVAETASSEAASQNAIAQEAAASAASAQSQAAETVVEANAQETQSSAAAAAATTAHLAELKSQYAQAESAVKQAAANMKDAQQQLGSWAKAGNQVAIDALKQYEAELKAAESALAPIKQQIADASHALAEQAAATNLAGQATAQHSQATQQQGTTTASSTTAVNENTSATEQNTGAQQENAQSTEGVAAAMAAAAGYTGQATAAFTNATGAAMAAANAALKAADGINSTGTAAASAAVRMTHMFLVLMLIRRALEELDKFRESEEQLTHFSDATGIAAENIARFQGAIALAGGDGQKFGAALMHLSKSMAEAQQGSFKMQDDLRRLGVTARDPIQAFYQIADTIHNTSDRMAALTVAAQILGASETDLVGIMANGSAELKRNYEASGDLAKARVAALNDAHNLTIAEQELKAAFETTATGALPLLTFGVRILGTVFDDLRFIAEIASDVIVSGYSATMSAAKSAGDVMLDYSTGNWEKLTVDAKSGLAAMRQEWGAFTTQVKADNQAAHDFVAKLWAEPPQIKTPPSPGGTPFPAAGVKPPTLAKQESDLRKADEEALDEIKDDHRVTINEVEQFWEKRYAAESTYVVRQGKLVAEYPDRIREINHTLAQLYQEQDRISEQHFAKVYEQQISTARTNAVDTGGHRAELEYLRQEPDALQKDVENGALGAKEALAKVMADIPRVVKEADAEAAEAVRKAVNDQYEVWIQGGHRTLAEIKNYWTEIAKFFYGVDEQIVEEADRKLAEVDERIRHQAEQLAALRNQGAEQHTQAQFAAQQTAIQGSRELGVNLGVPQPPRPTVQQGLSTLGSAYDAAVQEDRQIAALHQKEYQEALAANVREQQIYAQDPIKLQQVMNQEQAIIDKHNQQVLQDQIKLVHDLQAQWQQFFNTFNSGFTNAINRAISGQQSFGRSMQQLYNELLKQQIDYVATWLLKEGEKWLLSKIFVAEDTTVKEAANTTQTAGVGHAIAAQDAIISAADVARAESYAAVAAAGTLAYYAAVDPPAAPAAAAAQFGAAQIWVGLAAFESGTHYVPNTGVALVHQGERIVPAQDNARISAALAANGGSNTRNSSTIHAPITYAPTINHPMSKADLDDHMDYIFSGVKQRMRAFNR